MKGKPFERTGRKVTDLRLKNYDGWISWKWEEYVLNNVVNEVETVLDVEWVALILEAKELGLSIEEVHTFLQTSNKKE
jgi:hypothetical protein